MAIESSLKTLLLDVLAFIEPQADDIEDTHSGYMIGGNEAAKDLVIRIREELLGVPAVPVQLNHHPKWNPPQEKL